MTEEIAPQEPVFNEIEFRQNEVASYTRNIEMYKKMAENLPSEWPPHLIYLKNVSNRHEAIAGVEDLDDVELVSKLWAHMNATALCRSEYVERAKSQAILDMLLAKQAEEQA